MSYTNDEANTNITKITGLFNNNTTNNKNS